MENGGFGKVKWSWFWWEGKWKVLGGDGRTMGCLQGSDALPSYAQGKKVTHGQCPMLQSRNIEGETKLFKCNLCKRQNLLLIRTSKCYNILPSKTAKFNALDIWYQIKGLLQKNWQLFISNVIFSVLILKCGQLMLEPVRWDRDKCEMQRCRLSKDWTKINIYPPHLPIYIMVLMAASYEAMWVWEGLDWQWRPGAPRSGSFPPALPGPTLDPAPQCVAA